MEMGAKDGAGRIPLCGIFVSKGYQVMQRMDFLKEPQILTEKISKDINKYKQTSWG